MLVTVTLLVISCRQKRANSILPHCSCFEAYNLRCNIFSYQLFKFKCISFPQKRFCSQKHQQSFYCIIYVRNLPTEPKLFSGTLFAKLYKWLELIFYHKFMQVIHTFPLSYSTNYYLVLLKNVSIEGEGVKKSKIQEKTKNKKNSHQPEKPVREIGRQSSEFLSPLLLSSKSNSTVSSSAL